MRLCFVQLLRYAINSRAFQKQASKDNSYVTSTVFLVTLAIKVYGVLIELHLQAAVLIEIHFSHPKKEEMTDGG